MRKYSNGELVALSALTIPRYQSGGKHLLRLANQQGVQMMDALVIAVLLSSADDQDSRGRWMWWVMTSDMDVACVREKHLLPIDSIGREDAGVLP